MDKKMYMSPELEIIDLKVREVLLAGSPEDPDADGNPVKTITDPDDDDLDWGN